MVLDGWQAVFVGGMLGGVLLELIKLAAWQNATEIGVRYSDPRYWVGTVALLLAGGIVAVLNGVSHVPILKAAQYGLNAPAIVAGYATIRAGRPSKRLKNIDTGPADAPRRASVLQLLSWR
ncbi:MAG: hypothetical protein JWP49_2535 [Phenylobacterium sp.]|jgi:hypothetical protein|nr:hypothetical protein [Phenylobacterium sp.]